MDPVRDEAMQALIDAFRRAEATGQRNFNAMALATVGADGAPSVRTVLARAVDARGVAFYTDSRSRKGRALAGDPRGAACFYWEPIEEQVKIEGNVEPIADAEADEDYMRRPPGGRVLIHASVQSEPIEGDAALRARIAELAEHEAAGPLPRPHWWHGHRLVPSRVELWLGRRDRVHERIAFEHADGAWVRRLLSP
jgi:pyridoxamine 5'-phosphate oxidase